MSIPSFCHLGEREAKPVALHPFVDLAILFGCDKQMYLVPRSCDSTVRHFRSLSFYFNTAAKDRASRRLECRLL